MSEPSAIPESTPAEGPLLICFAVKEEAKFFQPPPGVRLMITGMGHRNAEQAMEKVFASFRPKAVLTCGFAGGLNPKLRSDDIVFDADELLNVRGKWEKDGGKPVNFFCAKRVAITSDEKQRLWRATGLDAIEMESQTIRDFCRDHHVPSATVRVISDSAMEDLPLDFNTLMTPTQRIDYGKLTWALVRAPMKLGQLLAFQQKTVSAAKALARFLDRALPL